MQKNLAIIRFELVIKFSVNYITVYCLYFIKFKFIVVYKKKRDAEILRFVNSIVREVERIVSYRDNINFVNTCTSVNKEIREEITLSKKRNEDFIKYKTDKGDRIK